MSQLLDTMQKFSAAEEFLDFLGVDYAPQVVHVNRLHILKRFQQYLGHDPVQKDLPEAEERAAYKDRLQHAYQDFVQSNAVTEKVFKVFQDAEGVQTVSVKKLKTTLEERRV
ncbi:MAG TPA: nitrogenase-stabilizing/protective protein NifW [Novimethylophilus sp.]|jgi:nitrogenase-stabilizing/protective protein|uniref:nitrogenase-stabilizing/protective protein NifW n=1 Tax=Novimethylophilus sp. TaxID=2137426 RepID=UPI002F3EB1AB